MRNLLSAFAILSLVLVAPLATMTAPKAAAQGSVEITQWIDTGGGGDTAECFVKNVVDPFNAQNNGVTVKATLQANSWDATRTAIAGGAGPDIVGTPGPSFAMQLALAGQLLDLDPYAKQYGWDERFSSGSLEFGKSNGKLFSLPAEVETLVLYYNKTLFQQKGWEPPKTMDDLMALAKQINDAGIVPFAHTNSEWRPTNEWFVGEFLNHGAGGPQEVYDALTGKTKWTSQDFVDSINQLNEIVQNGWFSGGLDRYYTLTSDDAGAMFGSGEAAMKIEGTWFLDVMHQYFGAEAGNNNELGWVPMPSVTGDAIFDLGIGNTYSINGNTKNPDAAAKYLDFQFSPASQARLLSQCGLVPAPMSLEGQDLTGVIPQQAEILAAMNKSLAANDYGYTTWTFWPPESENYLIENIEKVWAGDMTVEDYLAGHQAKFDAERAAGSVPPIPAR